MLYKNTKAQSTLEFTFAVVVIIFLIYGMVRVFRWVGMDLAQRRWAFDNSIMNEQNRQQVDPDPTDQLNPNFDRVWQLDAIYNGSIASGNSSL